MSEIRLTFVVIKTLMGLTLTNGEEYDQIRHAIQIIYDHSGREAGEIEDAIVRLTSNAARHPGSGPASTTD